jgi:two-component system, sensor histidine kinase and response regulator
MSRNQAAEGGIIPVVLIAEDHQDIRQVTKLLLQTEGCCAIEAANGLEAFQTALTVKIHLILMDIDMPIMDGLEATRCLRRNDFTCSVPIVAVTSNDKQRRQEALEAGCNEFIEKPLIPAVLRNALAKYVYSGINYTLL